MESRSSSSWNSEQSSSYNTIAFNVVSNRSPRLCSITWCSSTSDSIHRMLSSRLWICLMVDGIKDFSMAHKRQSYIDRCSGKLHYQPTRIFLVPIELYSLRPSITFIIYAAIFTEHVLHHVIRPRWSKNDTDDNDYDLHHHRDDNGGNNVTTGTVPVRGISPTFSSYKSSYNNTHRPSSHDAMMYTLSITDLPVHGWSSCC